MVLWRGFAIFTSGTETLFNLIQRKVHPQLEEEPGQLSRPSSLDCVLEEAEKQFTRQLKKQG